MNCALGAEFAQAVVFYTARSVDPTSSPRSCSARRCLPPFYANTTRLCADFDAAIHLDPTQPATYISRGLVHRTMGNLGRSSHRAAAKRSRLNPDNGAAYLNRTSAYAEMAEQEQAIADFSEAIRLNPFDLHSHFNRGKAYSQRGDYDKAIADFSRVLELNPNYVLANLCRGDGPHRNKGSHSAANL